VLLPAKRVYVFQLGPSPHNTINLLVEFMKVDMIKNELESDEATTARVGETNEDVELLAIALFQAVPLSVPANTWNCA
jgi:hypothetical protein